MWVDKGNMLSNDRSYYSNEYNNAFNRDYGMWSDKGTMLNNDRNYYSNEYNNAYNRDYAEHTTTEGYKYQDVADANAFAQWQANFDEGVRQYNTSFDEGVRQFNETMTFNKDQANKPTTVSTPTLTASEYNNVLTNAGTYAEQGKDALMNYLRGMMARGLSESEALNIYAQYFPAEEIPTVPGGGSKTTGSSAGGGLSRREVHVLN